MALGISQLGGEEGLYFRVLAQFVADHADTPARLTQALNAADWTKAERYAHSLKGIAGQIGASQLRTRAETLEHAIRERQAPNRLATLLADLLNEFQPLMAAVRSKLDRN